MAKTERPKSYGGLRVLIAGGGVAGLETLLALRALAGDLLDLELLAPEPEFWYRPLAVAEPFDVGRAHHFELAGIAETAAAGFTLGQLALGRRRRQPGSDRPRRGDRLRRARD